MAFVEVMFFINVDFLFLFVLFMYKLLEPLSSPAAVYTLILQLMQIESLEKSYAGVKYTTKFLKIFYICNVQILFISIAGKKL